MPDKPPVKDPAAEREARNYANPIASRELILETLEKAPGPLSKFKLAELLSIEGEDPEEGLRRRLIAMERDGQIIRNRRGAYGPVSKMDLVRGRVSGHRDGYGFVIVPGDDDIYLANRQMRKAFDGDEVLVRVSGTDFKGRREGSIVEVIERNTSHIVGRFVGGPGNPRVRPDNPRIVQDIFIAKDSSTKDSITKDSITKDSRLSVKEGQFVTVEITKQPDRFGTVEGTIAEVLGDHMAPGMEIDVAIRAHDIPHIWPASVEKESEAFMDAVAEKDKRGRIDLRDLPLVTIDGEDARDFDDAVYCERKKGGGWRLYVAIADVAHYVLPNSALDTEAQLRGTSVYFPDHVIPMLPRVLSNGLCSLNLDVDRLCMVCEMTISEAGRMSGYQFYEAVMHSHARLTYTKVGQMLADRNKKRSSLRQEYNHVVQHIDELHNLYAAFRKMRTERGAIDFETVETRIEFDENRKIERIVPVVRNDAHKLIEECMLAANVCAARFLDSHKIPALYRVHDSPKEQKLENLITFLAAQGVQITTNKQGKITPASYQEVMQSIAGRTDANIIQTVMLRSMNQAVYQPENKGHFGLAYQAYAHFTSPIRRYPDLLVHRAIRSVIRSGEDSARVKRHEKNRKQKAATVYPYDISKMNSFGEQCSLTERRADEATRDVMSWLKCEFLQGHIGESFRGVISAVTGFGFFVELKDLYVEGLVHISNLPQDYYHFEPIHHHLIGERTRKVFALGDPVMVRVAQVNLDERKVDFELEAKQPRKRCAKSATAEKVKADTPRANQSKAPAKKTSIKKAAIKKTAAKKATAKGTLAKRTSANSSKATEAIAKTTTTKRTPRKRAVVKKALEKSISEKPVSKKPIPTKKASTKKAPAKSAATSTTKIKAKTGVKINTKASAEKTAKKKTKAPVKASTSKHAKKVKKVSKAKVSKANVSKTKAGAKKPGSKTTKK